ncbi:N-6 DNA methylase [Nannocystis punicea]|uniref:N-6 DNA methylase n=1 Tax=Nannocystis punicea TaxID=2995304 RepID=A0ABY7GZG6_9BACT|nr:N-6 DNA methylase [Nannocystis poenicansa]WAS92260.1 N-6 DNA methylase [Nannocystis poenicansa]
MLEETDFSVPVPQAREVFTRLRNFLAGRLVGATRDAALLDEVLRCVFCRALTVRGGEAAPDEAGALLGFYRAQLARLKALIPDVFAADAQIGLDAATLLEVDRELRTLDLDDPRCDPIGDAYEVFTAAATRGFEGQFFTPQTAVRMLVDLVDPRPGERVIDPACGAGGFLSHTARRLVARGVPPAEVARSVVGIDKDRYLAGLARAHVGLVTMSPAQVHCGDTLAWQADDGGPLRCDVQGGFDVVLANPPFGAKIVAASTEVQQTFALGYVWRLGPNDRWAPTSRLQRGVSPQVLFVERLLALARPGGRVGLVVPESLISGKSYRHVVQYMFEQADLRAVIGMPEELFKTSGKGGTHTKVCLMLLNRREPAPGSTRPAIFMAEAAWCGKDSRGRSIARDELPEIEARFRQHAAGSPPEASRLGHAVAAEAVRGNVLAPRYYDPKVAAILAGLQHTHELVTVQQLLDDGILAITSGHEVGKLAYGGGDVPFVRTSDLSNWELKLDPKHCVGQEVYESLRAKQDVRAGDILMVRDGTYLIGTCAFITEHDTRIVFQSHLLKLRVCRPELLSPYLLLAALGSEPVRKQIEAKRFTQDIIDSLGDRVGELVLPLPRDPAQRARIAGMVEASIRERVASRERARAACLEVARVD